MKAQKITIDTIPNGSVIDIGGGGEGVIAQIGKDKVTVIDKHQEEINEAPHPCLNQKPRGFSFPHPSI